MSYQVLARKWRPSTFSQVIGQQHVVQALANAMETGRLHHAYLFTGTRGVGKTTLGRILAKSLNCEQGSATEPCGQCASCVEIDEGRFVDLIEIDAASRTKVEDTREILDNVQYRPTRGRYKVYLIDEVHMLSRHSFNALLKTLEEPPPHVKFLLATTDPQKLPITILSRCLQFNLKAMSLEQIQGQLEYILQQEGISFDSFALEQLARAAKGSMRDALSLTDQAIAHGQGRLTDAQVSAMLGLLDRDYERAILKALLSGDANQLMDVVAQVASFAPDYDKLMASLQSLLHKASLSLLAPAANASADSEQSLIQAIASYWAPEQIQLAYQVLVQGRRDLAFAPDPRSGLEMALLRIILFRPMQASDLPVYERAEQAIDVAIESDIIRAPEPEPELPIENSAQQALEAQQEQLLSMAESQGFQAQAATQQPEPQTVQTYVEEPVTENEQLSPAPEKAEKSDIEAEQIEPCDTQIKEEASPTSSLDAILKTRNLLRSQIKAMESQQPESSDESVVQAKVRVAEVKSTAEPAAQETEQTAPEKAPESPTSNAVLSDTSASNAEQEESQTSSTKSSELPATVEPERYKEQAPLTEEQTVQEELPPWQNDELPTLQGYDELPPVSDSFEPVVDEFSASQVYEPEPQPTAEATPDTTQSSAISEPLEVPDVDISQPYVDQKDWWEELIDTLGFDALKRQLALDSVLHPVGEGYELQVPEKAKHLASGNNLNEVITKIRGYVGQNTPIEVVLQAQVETETPREAIGRRSEERQQHAVATIHHDPVVKEIQETFDARIDQDTIKPK